MPTQTEAQVRTELKDVIAIFQEAKKFFGTNSSGNLSNYIARENTVLADVPGDYTPQKNNAQRQMRAVLNAVTDRGLMRAIVDPIIRNYAKVVGTIDPDKLPMTGPGGVLDMLKRYLATPASLITVQSRNITYGNASAGSNLGNGTVNRLTVDKYGQNLEACHMEVKRFECIQDETTGGDRNEEVFRVRNSTSNIDDMVITGSGLDTTMKCASSRMSPISNPSFSDYGGTITVLTDLSGWVPGSGAAVFTNLNLDQTNYYRTAGGTSDSTPAALKLLANESVSQKLNANNVKLSDDVPIYVQIAFNRSIGSADGRLTLSLGTESVDVVLSAQSGWTILRMTLNKGRYPFNFADQDQPSIKIQWSGRTTGTLLVDDVVMLPMYEADGLWYLPVGGSTPFVGENRDTFTFTDALAASDSIVQQFLWLLYGRGSVGETQWASWPSTTGAPTITDPSV